MLTTFEWLREELVAAGDSGVCLADLHSKRKEHWEELELRQVTGTYNSFAISFAVLIRLAWVELTGVEEPSYIQKSYAEAPPRKYYRLTPEGLSAPLTDWYRPIVALMLKYPERYPAAEDRHYKRKYIPTGRPLGRPRQSEIDEREHRGKARPLER